MSKFIRPTPAGKILAQKLKIEELERQLAELSPNRVDLVRVEGKACEIVGNEFINVKAGRWDKDKKAFVHFHVDSIPLIIVAERKS